MPEQEEPPSYTKYEKLQWDYLRQAYCTEKEMRDAHGGRIKRRLAAMRQRLKELKARLGIATLAPASPPAGQGGEEDPVKVIPNAITLNELAAAKRRVEKPLRVARGAWAVAATAAADAVTREDAKPKLRFDFRRRCHSQSPPPKQPPPPAPPRPWRVLAGGSALLAGIFKQRRNNGASSSRVMAL